MKSDKDTAADTALNDESPHKGKTGLRRVWNAFFYSLDGLCAAYKHEDAFRQEGAADGALLIPLVLTLPADGTRARR